MLKGLTSEGTAAGDLEQGNPQSHCHHWRCMLEEVHHRKDSSLNLWLSVHHSKHCTFIIQKKYLASLELSWVSLAIAEGLWVASFRKLQIKCSWITCS